MNLTSWRVTVDLFIKPYSQRWAEGTKTWRIRLAPGALSHYVGDEAQNAHSPARNRCDVFAAGAQD